MPARAAGYVHAPRDRKPDIVRGPAPFCAHKSVLRDWPAPDSCGGECLDLVKRAVRMYWALLRGPTRILAPGSDPSGGAEAHKSGYTSSDSARRETWLSDERDV